MNEENIQCMQILNKPLEFLKYRMTQVNLETKLNKMFRYMDAKNIVCVCDVKD
jgi:hypothetical protein